jgi:hypothetical protein
MVARIVTGTSIKGAIRYNEQKVAQGKAEQIMAYNFPSDSLSLLQKAARFQVLTSQRPSTKTNAVHISLNFDPTEHLDNVEMQQIAMNYLNKIGFDGQPFLLYRHFDAAHPHIHIVTTNIRNGGERISLHNIGKDISEPARKEIEREFGLIVAEGRSSEQEMYLKPVAPETALYGKTQTKTSISNVLRCVVAEYKFASIAELNAVLKLYNVIADQGAEGTRMQLKGGLQYSLLDASGKKIGVPIKASLFSTKCTLSELQKRFKKNTESKKQSKDGLKRIVDQALRIHGVTTKEGLSAALKKENITVVFRENGQGRLYGITFIDHHEKVVYNGSDLGKEYGASEVLRRLEQEQKTEILDQNWNTYYVTSVLKHFDYSKGFSSVLAALYQKGLRIRVELAAEGQLQFYIGHYRVQDKDYMPLNSKWNAYFRINGMSLQLSEALQTRRDIYLRSDNAPANNAASYARRLAPPTRIDNDHLQSFIEKFLNAPASFDSPVTPTTKRKKRERRI